MSLSPKGLRELDWLGLIERAHLAPALAVEPILREANELVSILTSSAKTANTTSP